MINELFKYEGNDLRVVLKGSEPFFCASDLSKALNYKDTSRAVSQHCKPKGTILHSTLTSGGYQDLMYIDEANMYRLVMGSKMKGAEKFQDWIVEDVLPSIRKNGAYSLSKSITPAQMLLQQAQMLVDMEAQIQEVKEEIKDIKAKSLSSPTDYYSIAGYASLIHQPIDIKSAANLGRKASSLCKTMGYSTGSMPDPRFGTVKLYPIEVLKEVLPEKNL